MLQVALLLAGLYFSGKTHVRIKDARQTNQADLPWMMFATAFTLAMLWLLVG
jgi:hypothetical protein